MSEDKCDSCGRWTTSGLQKWREGQKPIYGTDFSQPLSETVEKLRSDIAQVRGKLSDISFRYPGWGEHLKDVEGLLTCGLVALAYTKDEMKRCEAQTQPAEPAPAE